ncbi:Superfamily I DNA and RNA helicase [Desulfamplus magnetovallimortis]|uniref:Superfamily I DNA and RNA helicase n=1 Tax=Desulfamplus magnetovallimortis TaxID=1246637 RepID=A0A1W1HH55_9BACT|nr:UvrD-helicase domain-containing protein [Desulfamplus magnetovallimortis]SLM31712.1 Superfamily I DNA and RNA helicase [Desulfamplus magnetovallimortis]
MAQLMVHKNVLKYFNKIPANVQKRVAEFIDIFQKDPTDSSLHLHSLKESMADHKVRGANLPSGYRAIIIAPDKGEIFLLVHIDSHDKAYEWAKNKRFEVHPKTGVFQLFDVTEMESMAKNRTATPSKTASSPKTPTLSKTGAIDENSYFLSSLSHEDLFMAGVPKPLIPAVLAIDSDDAFDALIDYLPNDCKDVLTGIACGMSVDEALNEMLGLSRIKEEDDVRPEETGDFSNIDHSASFDLVLIDGEEHLKEILEGSLDEWRIFLHPYQKKMVRWQTKGPMNINGAAGTGKTVVMLHRAVHLANQLEDPNDKILITTFTTNLSITLSDYIYRMDKEAAKKIEVTNLHALARTICLHSGWKGKIGAKSDYDAIWQEIQRSLTGEIPVQMEEIIDEYWLVVDVNGIYCEDDYLSAVRTGRPRFSRKQKKAIWPVLKKFQTEMKKRNLLTFEGVVHQARLAVEQGNFRSYRHVLVDEVQDFSLEALRLIRSIAPVDKGLSDPLCTVGDGHQRIYRSKIPMSRAGIEIRGRSRRLKINYRTSEQIRRYSHGVLQGMEIDDLNGGSISITGDRSVFKGPEPFVEQCNNINDECETIISWVQILINEQGLKDHEICITPYKEQIVTSLTEAGFKIFRLKPREIDPGANEPGIRMGTMQRIKGLEFRAICLACGDINDPMNHMDKASPLQKCERYVAISRAREYLLVVLSNNLNV